MAARPRHDIGSAPARRRVHNPVESRRQEDAAASDRVDRVSVGGRRGSRGRVPDRRQGVFRNRLEPYAFGADGRDETTGKVRPGYLVTSWLSPGPHAFTVRALRASSAGQPRQGHEDGRRTGAASAGASGRARRNVAPKHPAPRARRPGSVVRERPGRALRRPRPGPCRHVDDGRRPALRPARHPDRIRDQQRLRRRCADDQVREPRVDDSSRLSCSRTSRTTRTRANGAGAIPGGERHIHVVGRGDTLTLAPSGGADPCRQRGAILTGEWTR